CMQDKQLPLTF
nr:immunoglobulin light chain junction region [Macaca mulatta]MOX47812.1 immunoglobulin light chain junction region [Macaca mulatta]MOX47950.1 immunoglobulin light chain junction region [Macaca mulatta]MOX48057.1 immunoglobulin light chain junction region [Macaca mulatta]MOX48101.1 immunoglobulin light chain junction region [Macaca mulatta]